ncbi:glycosyltransferase family 1 protein [Candidatus Albibeggiatoa sp. nov. BB20]|uniref:glycosyltransferase family 4 protein n=1 Tax=Candidatus Albibeggiatoa sp. nov. BB20 TaxID=3162723 RepID=UPI0033655B67
MQCNQSPEQIAKQLLNVVQTHGWKAEIESVIQQELLPLTGIKTCTPALTELPQTTDEYVNLLKKIASQQITIQHKSIRMLLDAAFLGRGHCEPEDKAGLFRVTENFIHTLLKYQDKQNIHFYAAERSFPAYECTRAYLYSNPQLADIPLHHKNFLPNTDIIHSSFYSLPDKTTKAQRFLTVHDLIPIRNTYFTGMGTLREMKAKLDSLRPDDWVICISNYVKQDFCDFTGFDPNRVFVAYEGADSETFYPCTDKQKIQNVLKKYNLPDAPYVLVLSTLDARRNLEHIIRSFIHTITEAKLDDLNLVMVGSKNPQREQAISKLVGRFQQRIILTERVEDQDMAALYSGALVFASMSFAEGFGLTPLEAMQCGTPVIAANATSLPEVVGDGGILLSPTNMDSLSDSLLQIYQNSELRQNLAQKAINQAKKFSWDQFTQDTLAAYQVALDTTNRQNIQEAFVKPVLYDFPISEHYRQPNISFDISYLGHAQYQQYAELKPRYKITKMLLDALVTLNKCRSINLTLYANGYDRANEQAQDYILAHPELNSATFILDNQFIATDIVQAMTYPFPPCKAQARIQYLRDMTALVYPQFRYDTVGLERIIYDLQATDYIICPSNATKNAVCEDTKLNPEQVFIIPEAVNKHAFYPKWDVEHNIRAKYHIPTEIPYFISFATLDSRKNIVQLIRSFIHLVQQQNIQDIRLVLIGANGWQFEHLLAELGLYRKFIITTGYVEQQDIAVLYTHALAFVYPSLYEASALPILEAMNCGTPIISSDLSAISEIVETAGILTNPLLHDDLSQAMLDIYQQTELRKQLSQSGLQQAQKYAQHHFIQGMLYAYKTALEATW